MKLIFLGAPGSGKGTQAKKLAQILNLEHISTGDILREAIKEQTSLGVQAKVYMDVGELVPDEIILGLIKEVLTDGNKGFILDGFPRTTTQAVGLENILSESGMGIDKVLNLNVSDSAIVERLTARRLCDNCGSEYNLKTRPPAIDEVCDNCGGKLYRRDDDSAEVIQNRLLVYHRKTEPIKNFYRSRGLLADIDGNQDFDEVFGSITRAVADIK